MINNPRDPGPLIAVHAARTTDVHGAVGADFLAILSDIIDISETEVFNGTGPSTWTDLDLSSKVGSNKADVILKVLYPNTGGEIAFRQKGDTDEQYGSDVLVSRGCAWFGGHTSVFVTVRVITDAAGIIEWRCNPGVAATTIDVIRFIR